MKPATNQTIKSFFQDYPLVHYKKGHVLILPGDFGQHAYYLVSGKVKVYDTSYRGEEIIITSRVPPAFFPLSLVINTGTTRYFYEATSDISVREAPIEAVQIFLDRHPTVVMDLLSHLYTTLDNILERMVHYITSNAKSRLIYALACECREFGIRSDDNSYRIDINERELGSRAGLSRETVSREARALKRNGLLQIHHNYMIISDLDKLERLLKSYPKSST